MSELNKESYVSRVLVFNPKGGVGKTAVSLNISLSLGHRIITNDQFSIVNQVLPEDKFIILDKDDKLIKSTSSIPIIYDFGGFLDDRLSDVFSMVEKVIIPILPFKENLQISLDCVEEIKELVSEDKIVLVINQVTDSQYKEIYKILKVFCPKIPVFPLKRSTVFYHMILLKRSISSISKDGGLFTYHFKTVADQFDLIIQNLYEKKDEK
jgi:cellulose biosynthesis protein BcsQ